MVARRPDRADSACFVGFVGRRGGALPAEVRRWLVVSGWASASGTPAGEQRSEADVQALLDVPVPIERWEDFDRLFQWERRQTDADASTYLGAAVRSFFAQGGRRCYVIRVGDPWPLAAPRDALFRQRQLARLIPGYPNRLSSAPADRTSWSGIGHVFGLPEVSFLCLPDLADAVAAEPPSIAPPLQPPRGNEEFVECSLTEPAPPQDPAARRIQAPRCDEDGYKDWASALHRILESVSPRAPTRHQLEIQVVAAVPLPSTAGDSALAELDLLKFLEGQKLLAMRKTDPTGLRTAFLQLAYPWARTPGSGALPEGLEPPDAILCGVLARNALVRGTYRSISNAPLGDVFDVFPELAKAQIQTAGPSGKALIERVCLLGQTPSGLRLLSDVTTSLDESYRAGGTTRLVGAICRAARDLGTGFVFEPSNEGAWARLRQALEELLLNLWQAGALRGATPAQGFSVRCDRSTMTQDDIDNGRIIAQVKIDAALALETIVVSMELDQGGPISLASAEAA